MGYLDPMPGAVEWIERFGIEGYPFECLTSQSSDKCAGDLRRYNLAQVLISIVRRKNGNELFQFNGKYSIRLLFFFTSLISCINPLVLLANEFASACDMFS
mgnify:CR=1 FL=1